MRKNSIKNTRINGEVQRELSQIIRGEIKDPRIALMTSVTGAEVAPDLKTCKVYISVLGDDRYDCRPLQCRGLYPPDAGQEPESAEYSGAVLRAG